MLILALAFIEVPSIAAGGLLHPARVALYRTMPAGCVEREFAGDGLALRGWLCAARAVWNDIDQWLVAFADPE